MDNQTTALVKRSSSPQEVINLSDYIASDIPTSQHLQFISNAALKQGTLLLGGVGAGKSRLLGRVFAWQYLIQGKPAVILDPTGAVIDNLYAKILHLTPEYQERLWPRIKHFQVGAKDVLAPAQLYYDNSGHDSLFEIANRFPSVLKLADPQLTSAPILGWNSLYECLIYAGLIAAAKKYQLDFVADLIEHPSKYKGLLREVLAERPELRPAVEYFRELMDPKASGIREKRTGSAKSKLLPFLADPIRMATYAANSNSLDWLKLLAQRKIIVIDYREQLDPDYLQFDMIWHVKTFMDAIKSRGMAGRNHECLLILDEFSAMTGQRRHDGHSILAEYLQELISRLGRNYGVNTVISLQALFQVDEPIQNLLLNMGNLLVGRQNNANDALLLARGFLRHDPYKIKKVENVWGTVHPPAILSFFGGPDYPYPRVIDHRTIEFTPEEQLLDWVNKILFDLDRFQFLAHIATGEGGKRGPITKLSIANLDKNQYPNEAILAPLRHALAQRDGVPVEILLAKIHANRIEVLPEKKEKFPRQPMNEPATMENDHDQPTNTTPTLSHSGEPSADSGHPTSRATGSGDFWEAKASEAY